MVSAVSAACRAAATAAAVVNYLPGPAADLVAQGVLQGPCLSDGLGATVRRLGPETYRNIMSSGCRDVKDYVSRNFQGSTTSTLFIDLWAAATNIDFKVAHARSEDELQSAFSACAGGRPCGETTETRPRC